MKALIPVFLITVLAFSACKKCQYCEYQWEYTEDSVTYKGLEISKETCGFSWQLEDDKQEVQDDRDKLQTLLNKDPDKKNITVTSITCTETPY